MENKVIVNDVKRRPGRPRKHSNEKVKEESKHEDKDLEMYITHIVDNRIKNIQKTKTIVPQSMVPSAPALLKIAPLMAPVFLPLATSALNCLASYLNKKKEPIQEKSRGASCDGSSLQLSSII